MPEYSEVFEPYIKWANQFSFIRFNIEMFNIDRSAKILDIGCGFGHRIKLMRKEGYKNVSGIEPDKYSVERANDSAVTLGDLYDTGYPNESVEVVLVENVFHHIDDYKRALDEIIRILKPDMYLCFFEPRKSFFRSLIDFLTFKTFIPDLLKGPWEMRRQVMGQEIETGLYPLWLKSHRQFFDLLEENFEITWQQKNPFFFYAKCRKRLP